MLGLQVDVGVETFGYFRRILEGCEIDDLKICCGVPSQKGANKIYAELLTQVKGPEIKTF